jgi:galactose mutarotase-like enzyme
VRGGNPILFPICGNVPNDTYTLDGQQYQLAQHGFARNLPWAVVGHQTDGTASLTIKLTPTPATLAVYPFQFELLFTYKLQGNTLTIEQSIRNHSDRPMPFSIGFHPYFEVGNKQQLTVELPSQFYQQKDGGTDYPFDGTFDYNQPEIDIAFPQLHGNTATIIDRDRGQKTTLTYDEDFSTLVFWTLQGKNFVCVEPWSGPRNAINTGHQLTILEPQGSLDTSITISVASL